MIYFLQNTVTKAIKIGYSRSPKHRSAGLQTATPDKLVLLGTTQGGLEVESALHERFAKYALGGEWFKGDILREVTAIIAHEAAGPQVTKTNVIVVGDSDPCFVLSSDERKTADKARLESAVFQGLSQIHAKTPIAWLITGGERLLEHFAEAWARQNNVQHHEYRPNWKKYSRFAGFKVGPQMLRAQFDPKLLFAVSVNKISANTRSLIRRAEKAGIEVVKMFLPELATSSSCTKTPNLDGAL